MGRDLFKNIPRVIVHACLSHVMSHLFLEEAAAAAAASAIHKPNEIRTEDGEEEVYRAEQIHCTPISYSFIDSQSHIVGEMPIHHHTTCQCRNRVSSVLQMVQNQTWLSSQVHSGCCASWKVRGGRGGRRAAAAPAWLQRPRQLLSNKKSADPTA